MWREDLKGCTLCKTEPLEYQTKGLCTRGGYLQGIRRITAEFERALYYC